MSTNDWRLQGQEEILSNKNLTYKKYCKISESNDHEHCAFCWKKFSEYEGEMHYGYTTLDNKYWICENCYNDFCSSFNWQISQK